MNIEESIQQIETLIEAWQLDEADLNQTDINAMQALLKENQELKKHLKVPKAYNLKTLEDYKSYYEDITREQILEDTYIEYCAYVNLAHRYSELKKQLENTITSYTEEHNLRHNSDLKLDVLETQQKEFIKWLEDKTNICDGFLDTVKSDLQEIPYGAISVNKTYITTQIKENEIAHKVYEEILQKYKSIIGDDK